MPATPSTVDEPWMVRGNLAAEMRETHTGIVALLGDRAYKAKKALTTDFLDFSTPDRREQACAHEVALNRRLAPDSYLGVGHFGTPESGSAEPVIVMRRYPNSARLATLVKANEPVRHHLCAVAELLADFRGEPCTPCPDVAR